MLYPEEISRWTREEKNRQTEAGRELARRLQSAIDAGARNFDVPKGDYRFPGTVGLVLKHAEKISIAGNGSTFWFSPEMLIGLGFAFCRGVEISDLIIDMERLPFLQGRIESVEPESFRMTVQLDHGSAEECKKPTDGQNFRMTFLDETGNAENDTPDCRLASHAVVSDGSGNLRITLPKEVVSNWQYQLRPPRPGDRVALGMRHEGGTVDINHCSEMVFSDITVYASPGFVFFERGSGGGGNTYRRCRLVRRPGTDRLLAGAADCFHSLNQRRGPLVEDCEFSWAMDDLVNIHGYFQVVLEKRRENELVVIAPYETNFIPGTEIVFCKPPCCEVTTRARILACEALPESAEAASALARTEFLRKHRIELRDFPDGRPYLIKLDSPVPEVEVSDLAASYDHCGAGAVLRNNFFHNGHVRGILLKSRNCRIENNRIEHIALNGIILKPEIFYLEGPPPQEIQITGNILTDCAAIYTEIAAIAVFCGCCPPPSDRFTSAVNMSGIQIRRNQITRCNAGPGIVIANCEKPLVHGNEIREPFSNPEALSRISFADRLAFDTSVLTSQQYNALRHPFHAIVFLCCEAEDCAQNILIDPARRCTALQWSTKPPGNR